MARRSLEERRWTRDYLRSFGAPVEQGRSLERLAAYFRVRQSAEPGVPGLDDRAWADLTMDAVFTWLDRTASHVGGQVLYDRLRRPAQSQARVEELDRAAEFFTADARAREAIAVELLRLRGWHASFLCDLIWGGLPGPHPWQWAFPVLAVLPLAFVAWALVWPRALLFALAALVVNYVVKIRVRPALQPYIPAMRALPGFIGVAQALGARHDEGLAGPQQRLREHHGALRFLRGAVRWIAGEGARDIPALGVVADLVVSAQEYVNIALLLDVNAFYFAVERIRAHRAALADVFSAVGEIDMALAVASVRKGRGGAWARPDFTAAARSVEGRGLVHPLVPRCVPNDLVTGGHGWLVTGSNMSGKSTFLRTVGVNTILAQALGTCLGTAWRAPRLAVRTCIGRGDNILEGKSYYLAEAEAVRDLLAAAATGVPHLFILDELFRGTNTVERIAAARAVLEALDDGPHVVLVATHDIELIRWLGTRYQPMHFREQVADGELSFDYLLKPGPSSTRNAIALLRHLGYPEGVVRTAEATVLEEEEPGGPQQQRLPGRE
jgi:hypothetical protein